MNTEPAARYRLRPTEEIEAVQWTGTNVDALRAFCGPDFDTIDPEDRAEDPDQDAQLLSDASHWVGLRPGDWVLRHVDHFTATSDEAFRAVWEPAVPVPPPTDQAALRDRIRRAVCEAEGFMWDSDMLEPDEYGDVADAVLAVLPEPADRGAVLLWAADQIDAETRQAKADEVLEPDKYRPCRDASAQLRRLAVEAPTTTKPEPERGGGKFVPCGFAALGHDHPSHVWQPQPGMAWVRCPGPSKPAAGVRQDGAQP